MRAPDNTPYYGVLVGTATERPYFSEPFAVGIVFV